MVDVESSQFSLFHQHLHEHKNIYGSCQRPFWCCTALQIVHIVFAPNCAIIDFNVISAACCCCQLSRLFFSQYFCFSAENTEHGTCLNSHSVIISLLLISHFRNKDNRFSAFTTLRNVFDVSQCHICFFFFFLLMMPLQKSLLDLRKIVDIIDMLLQVSTYLYK